MTEDEAKTKLCCGPLHPYNYQRVGELEQGHTELLLCQGSRCMAWRQETDIPLHPAMTEEKKKELRSEGYCGLAGKP